MKEIYQVPEERKVFAGMPVHGNVKTGAYCWNDKKEIEEDLEFVFQFCSRLCEYVKKEEFGDTLRAYP